MEQYKDQFEAIFMRIIGFIDEIIAKFMKEFESKF